MSLLFSIIWPTKIKNYLFYLTKYKNKFLKIHGVRRQSLNLDLITFKYKDLLINKISDDTFANCQKYLISNCNKKNYLFLDFKLFSLKNIKDEKKLISSKTDFISYLPLINTIVRILCELKDFLLSAVNSSIKKSKLNEFRDDVTSLASCWTSLDKKLVSFGLFDFLLKFFLADFSISLGSNGPNESELDWLNFSLELSALVSPFSFSSHINLFFSNSNSRSFSISKAAHFSDHSPGVLKHPLFHCAPCCPLRPSVCPAKSLPIVDPFD
ncbi:hypothetical protein BpHYR1_028106 [Brachionus plicatilis]|uniref:Uncharacterized protein n=1 Tax=Brachionus plicatilis TaxID=10195 RepID=A0A3M7R9S2_BRAPC|nr:hypothetical protein BpHYR1_028106 [Brachionus plicatilis]